MQRSKFDLNLNMLSINDFWFWFDRARILLHLQQLILPCLIDLLPSCVMRYLLVICSANGTLCCSLTGSTKARSILLSKTETTLYNPFTCESM